MSWGVDPSNIELCGQDGDLKEKLKNKNLFL
jgi:hypothetical protein